MNPFEGKLVSLNVSLDGELSFFRRTARDHVFSVAVSLIVAWSGVDSSLIMVIPLVAERTWLSFWKASFPLVELSDWRMVL